MDSAILAQIGARAVGPTMQRSVQRAVLHVRILDRLQGPAEQSVTPATEALDQLLMAGYDPATSAAWAGAAPWHLAQGAHPAVSQLTFDLFAPLEAIDAPDADDHTPFRKDGFQVRAIEGKGKTRILDAFVSRHHHSLRGGGMSGRAFGMYDPENVLVGMITFARPTNPKTASGMQVAEVGDEMLSPATRAHITHSEAETVDCTRLCIADVTPSGIVLGKGAESFLFTAAMRLIADRNRALWRAIRMVEIGLPPTREMRQLIESRASFCKCIRTFATAGSRGVSYMASGLLWCGTGRVEHESIGKRSGDLCGGRSLAKLANPESKGHEHQVLRAVWEGSHGQAIGLATDGKAVVTLDLMLIRDMVPNDLSPLDRQHALKRAWHELRARAERNLCGNVATWRLEADESGYDVRRSEPKHRYVGYLGAPYYVAQIARRCRYLRGEILTAETVWFALERRWPRGIGFGWKRRPHRLGAPSYPTA